MNWLWTAVKWIGGVFTGGSLESILRTIETSLDDEVQKEQVKAEVTKEWIRAQASLLVGRTWWFQLFFVIPLGYWWTWVIIDSVHHLPEPIHALPAPLDGWAGGIISALFLVDGGKALINRFGK